MEIKDLRVFLHVAETLSFHRAAERLNSSQPVVTKTIARLEHVLGLKLFERSTRHVALTPAGAVLLLEGRPLLANIESVQRTVRHATTSISRRFSVGASTAAMQTVTPVCLRRFRLAYPEVELDVQEMTTRAQVAALLSAEIDVGFVLAPGSDPALSTKSVYKERLRLAVPDCHPLATSSSGRPVPLSAFASDHFIMPPRSVNPAMHDEIIMTCERAGFRPRVKECRQDETCLSLAKSGLGIVFIMGSRPELSLNGLASLELEEPVPEIEIFLAWRTDDPSGYLDHFFSFEHDATNTLA